MQRVSLTSSETVMLGWGCIVVHIVLAEWRLRCASTVSSLNMYSDQQQSLLSNRLIELFNRL